MIKTRDSINACGRIATHAEPRYCRPDATRCLDEASRQVEELGIDGFKLYTGNPGGPWMFDDEKISYPLMERILELGATNVSTHKGLALGGRIDAVLQAA